MAFAEHTPVPIEKSQAEIARLARQYGATEFSCGYSDGEAGLSFVMKNRRVSFSVNRPKGDDKRLRAEAQKKRGSLADNLVKIVDAEERRLWRCLLLRIKAKLVAAENDGGIFEEEFLAHFATPTGETLIQRIRAIEQGSGPKMLAAAEPRK